jgi:hypothetical protein
MTQPADRAKPSRRRAALGAGVVIFLLLWNGLTALYANPFSLTQWYDGIQYQLLARNRLAGHEEIGDTAHTVRREGRHPMWRPGLVWIEQGLAACTGSVRTAAALASALGTTLLELILLWLAWRGFGALTAVVVGLGIVTPWPVGASFMGLAVGQGPEPWAAAAILLGIACLTEAWRRPCWGWALAAGLGAGSAEWFRTGTLLLFAAPCVVHGLTALGLRRWKLLGGAATALAGALLMAFLAGRAVPSLVDKTAVNFRHNLAENDGPFLHEDVPGVGPVTFSMGGYLIVPGTNEVANDHIVREARASSESFLADHFDVIYGLYLDRLSRLLASGGWGLRWLTGEIVLALFCYQLLISLLRRDGSALLTVSAAGAVLAYYLGPVALLRGDQPTHYLLMALPLVLLVAARGAVGFLEWAAEVCRRHLPSLADWVYCRRLIFLALLSIPVLCLNATFYQAVLTTLRDYQQQAQVEQAAVDDFPLEGKTVACRNMSWFVDRDVETVLLPYATVPELERYVRARGIDGILVWDRETQVYFRATPYGSPQAFDRALRKSPVFDSPQVSGAWRWYPVRRTQSPKGRP